MDQFIGDYLEDGCGEVLTQVVLDLLADDEVKQARLDEVSGDFPGFLARALLIALRNPNVPTREGVLWSRGTGVLAWKTGDIFGTAPKGKRPSITVIPVNTAFDVHVTRKSEGNVAPLISERTLHGQWIVRMAASGVGEKEISGRIRSDLIARNAFPDTSGRYPIGTVAVIEHRNAVYYLLALASFDESNRAQSSETDVRTALGILADFYDHQGQGADIYIPLVGTGMSRAALTYRESLDLIVDAFTGPDTFLAGRGTIVVEPNAAKALEFGE